jgi:hypothetical protein
MEATKSKPKRLEPDPLDPAVVLTFADLDLISRSIRKPVATQEELLAAIQSLTAISVEGIPIPLEPRLLMRLKTRCLDKAAWPGWLREVVTRQLHDYAGW